jgi:hypothetical protein
VEEARWISDPDDVADWIQLDLADAHASALVGENDVAWRLVERVRHRAKGIDMDEPALQREFIEACVLQALGDLDGARWLLEA